MKPTPKALRASPLKGATLANRQSRLRGVPGLAASVLFAGGSRGAAGRLRRLAAALAVGLAAAAAQAGPITVHDDQGRAVTLAAPARRAITVAPHATELVYAAGAGRYLAGAARGSDYPPAARALPSIGDALRPSLESAAALRPDLLIAWQPAMPDPLGDLMGRLGVPVYYSDPRTLAAIPDAVETMGRLFGTEDQAAPAAAALRARLSALSARYAGRTPVRVFIQAGLQPIYTLNGASIVSDAVRLCGGVNVYADAAILAPQVSLESVLAARPDAVLVGTLTPGDTQASRQAWQQRGLPAALHGRIYGLDADSLYRPGPRLVDAAEQLCAALDEARR
ncbi:cobalamin-binding protein [Bordetella sp. BOR01]|uniref:cobalamin-binding protein n=1 Tax=Bordetella sp. BOR01 TaxID=2854779 RepID=UPI001C484CAD|nr:cobalamin-binding protein [Bordetella sp. BOR01]MBV7484446.1 cobalamin-binding protein [Bordetella sp. BOR01]